MKKNKYRIGIVVVTLLIAGLLFSSLNRDNRLFLIDKNLDIYYTLFRELSLFYVDEINSSELVKTSIDEMLQSLDPYTNYIPESEIEDFKFVTTGEYAGIGTMISKHKDKIVVSEPYEGTPAHRAGIIAGDVILEVSGKETKKMTIKEVSTLLKGQTNKSVKIKIQRPGEQKPRTFDIVREKIQIEAVPYYGMIDDNTGYIRLSNFTADCSSDVKKALLELKEQKNAKSIVLDLRSNPGGLLREAVNITNLFVPKGQIIVSTHGKVKQWDKVYVAKEEPVDTLMPVAVIVNRGSASASEIVAGALQDLDRAVIVGTRTFGKGLVQTTRDLSYNTRLKVTTAKYYIPSGRCIQALDYSNRNADGSVGSIPDSLISEFSTKKGRKVYDGGGIVPDEIIDLDVLSSLSIHLAQDFMFFDFATKFASENETIDTPEEFIITSDTFDDFKDFVKSHNFSYESATEKLFAKLESTAKNELYYDIAKVEFGQLKEKIGHELDKDLEQFKEEIKSLLTDEIVTRYYFQKGAIRSAIVHDKGINKAKELIKDTEIYSMTFTPGRIISMESSYLNK